MEMRAIPDRDDPKDRHYPEVSIKVQGNDLTMDDVFEDLVRPLLLGMGFHHENISEWIGE